MEQSDVDLGSLNSMRMSNTDVDKPEYFPTINAVDGSKRALMADTADNEYPQDRSAHLRMFRELDNISMNSNTNHLTLPVQPDMKKHRLVQDSNRGIQINENISVAAASNADNFETHSVHFLPRDESNSNIGLSNNEHRGTNYLSYQTKPPPFAASSVIELGDNEYYDEEYDEEYDQEAIKPQVNDGKINFNAPVKKDKAPVV